MPNANIVAINRHIRPLAVDAPVAMWLVDLTVSPDPHVVGVLSAQEKARAARFVRSRERDRYEAAHAALHLLVERHWSIALHHQRFACRLDGGWHLPDNPSLRVSLSYAGDHALIGLAQGRAIGIDLELDRRIDGATALSRTYFDRSERFAYARLGSSRRSTAFLQGWTRKEACAKALGLGLSLTFANLPTGIGTDCRTITSSVGDIDVASFRPTPHLIGAWARLR